MKKLFSAYALKRLATRYPLVGAAVIAYSWYRRRKARRAGYAPPTRAYTDYEPTRTSSRATARRP